MKDIHTFVILAYLENDNLLECVKSVLNQTVKSNVIIATSTKNDYIIDLASEYGLGVMVNDTPSNKGNDYNYALDAFDTEIVTIAHQDDIYDRNYVKNIMKCYENNKDASIIITDYYEVLGDKRLKRSKSLLKKHFLVKPLKYKKFQTKKYFKLRSLKYNQSFCTSSVTYVKKNIKKDFFPTDLTYNNDWQAFINLAKEDSKFIYIDKKLVGYRLDNKEICEDKIKEDILVYKSVWSEWLVNYIYKKKEKKESKKEEKSRVNLNKLKAKKDKKVKRKEKNKNGEKTKLTEKIKVVEKSKLSDSLKLKIINFFKNIKFKIKSLGCSIRTRIKDLFVSIKLKIKSLFTSIKLKILKIKDFLKVKIVNKKDKDIYKQKSMNKD